MATKYIDYLNEDKPIAGQLWVCLSFLSPEGLKNCSLRGLKVRGVFGTKREADDHALELQKIDPDFHVFVGEVGKWLPWDPEPSEVDDNVYAEKELNDLMSEYRKNMQKAKEMENQRKRDLLEKASKDESVKSMRPVDRKRMEMQQKLAKKKEDGVEKLEGKDFIEEEKKINIEKEEVKKVEEEVKKSEASVNELDEKMERIKALYNKLQEK